MSVEEPLTIESEFGTIYVMIDPSVEPEVKGVSSSSSYGPSDATPVGVPEDIKDSLGLVRDSLVTVAKTVHAGLQDGLEHCGPDEWSIELAFSFKGKSGIPLLISGEAAAAIKVQAKWVKTQAE